MGPPSVGQTHFASTSFRNDPRQSIGNDAKSGVENLVGNNQIREKSLKNKNSRKKEGKAY